MKPYPFQRKMLRRLLELEGRGLVCATMGAGKTPLTYEYAKRAETYPMVVVCPASVKWGWHREAEKHFGLMPEVLEGTKPYRLPKNDVYVINYDILHGWVNALRKLNPALIVGDEAQYLKTKSARRSKSFRELIKGQDKLLLLTGTPIVNRPSELFNIINMLWPEDFPSFFSFGVRYCDGKKKFFGWDFNGASNLEELHEWLKVLGTIRVSKKVILRDLPQKTLEVLPIPITRQEIYLEAKKDFVTWLKKISPQKAKRAERAIGLNKIGYLKRLAAKLKMTYVFQWIDQFLEDGNDKLVVFAIHKKAIKALLKRYGETCVVINGGTPTIQRQEMVHKFVNNPNIRIFVGNIQSAGVGLDGLQHAANTGLIIEMPWTPGAIQQAMGRIARIGQALPVQFWILVAKDTIEESLCEILQQKSRIIDAVMEGKETQDLDIYNELLNQILKEENLDVSSTV